MIEIDCSELTADEQLALAGAITEALQGSGMAFVKGKMIALDALAGSPIDEKTVESAVGRFVARRQHSEWYSTERQGDRFIVHSADPVAAKRPSRPKGLPPNLYKCPFCPFVTPYEEAYVVHYRAHAWAPMA